MVIVKTLHLVLNHKLLFKKSCVKTYVIIKSPLPCQKISFFLQSSAIDFPRLEDTKLDWVSVAKEQI